MLLIPRIFDTTMSDPTHQLFTEEKVGSEEENSTDRTQSDEKRNSKEVKGKTAAVAADDPILASSKVSSGSKISAGMVQEILKANPSLAAETQGADPKMIQEMLGRLTLEEMLTGMVCSCSVGYILVIVGVMLTYYPIFRPPVARTKRTWHRISFGQPSQ